MRRGCKLTVGSNPTLSANSFYMWLKTLQNHKMGDFGPTSGPIFPKTLLRCCESFAAPAESAETGPLPADSFWMSSIIADIDVPNSVIFHFMEQRPPADTASTI